MTSSSKEARESMDEANGVDQEITQSGSCQIRESWIRYPIPESGLPLTPLATVHAVAELGERMWG
eukprot:726161-Karenia_brevis.AAC.1